MLIVLDDYGRHCLYAEIGDIVRVCGGWFFATAVVYGLSCRFPVPDVVLGVHVMGERWYGKLFPDLVRDS